MRLALILLLVPLVGGITVGQIQNAAYQSNDPATTNFNTTCQQCLCQVFASTSSSTYVAFNCYTNNNTCTLFYNYSTSYRLLAQPTSTFYFYPNPPPVILVSSGWNTNGTTVAGITGASGTAANQLTNPFGVSLDSSDTLYIADRGNNRVQKWKNNASSGTTVAGSSSGATGSSLSLLCQPGNVAVDDSGNLYVTEVFGYRVLFWSVNASAGILVAGTGTAGAANNQLDQPHDIAYDWSSNILYISEYANHRVMKYLPNATSGILVAGGNGAGVGITQLYNPVGLYLDLASNSLYIANFGAHTIVRWVLGASSWTLVAGMSATSGSTSILLNHPGDVTLDYMGNIYVADTYNHRIQFFSVGQTNGTTIAGVDGVAGTAANQFNLPFGLTVNINLTVYVADYGNHRVQKFLYN